MRGRTGRDILQVSTRFLNVCTRFCLSKKKEIVFTVNIHRRGQLARPLPQTPAACEWTALEAGWPGGAFPEEQMPSLPHPAAPL